MYRGTTPTYTFTLPESVDMTQATDVFVTFGRQDGSSLSGIFTKTGDDIEVTQNTVSVWLDQAETLSFPVGRVAIQLNWLYPPNKRACSNIIYVNTKTNLIDEVIEHD